MLPNTTDQCGCRRPNCLADPKKSEEGRSATDLSLAPFPRLASPNPLLTHEASPPSSSSLNENENPGLPHDDAERYK